MAEDATSTDILLIPFVEASGETAEARLSELIAQQTESTIKGIIRSRLQVSLSTTDCSHNNQEALDLVSDVQADLLGGLRGLKNDADRTIRNLHTYVATVTFNACHQWLRRKYPERLRLKNKLRYLLTHVPEFALWETDQREWLCGFAAMRKMPPAPPGTVKAIPQGQGSRAFGAGGPSRETLIELLRSLFTGFNGAARFEDVVTRAAESLGIRDERAQSASVIGRDAPEPRSSVGGNVLTDLEQRHELQRLWAAICDLPLRHRTALLLNLRDRCGGDALALLPSTGIATIDDIARAVSLEPAHLARIWNDLPWDDRRIAEHLGLTRQQVINLRQSARARLVRLAKGL